MATTIKPTLAKTPEVCVQTRQEIAATAKIEHAESSLISYNVPNTPSGHNRPTVLQEGLKKEPLAKLQWCDEFSTGMSGKRGVRGVLG